MFAAQTQLQRDLDKLRQALITARKDGEALIVVAIDGNRVVSPMVYRMIASFGPEPISLASRKTYLLRSQVVLKLHQIEKILLVLEVEEQAENNRNYLKTNNRRRKT